MKPLLTIILVVAWCSEYSLVATPDPTAGALLAPALEQPIPEQTAGMSESSESESRTEETRTSGQFHSLTSAQRSGNQAGWRSRQVLKYSPAVLPLASRLQI